MASSTIVRRSQPSGSAASRNQRSRVTRSGMAELDSSPLPESPLLVGKVEGAPRAALALRSRRAVADPFHPSAWLVSLLALRADQLSSAAADERNGCHPGGLGIGELEPV